MSPVQEYLLLNKRLHAIPCRAKYFIWGKHPAGITSSVNLALSSYQRDHLELPVIDKDSASSKRCSWVAWGLGERSREMVQHISTCRILRRQSPPNSIEVRRGHAMHYTTPVNLPSIQTEYLLQLISASWGSPGYSSGRNITCSESSSVWTRFT